MKKQKSSSITAVNHKDGSLSTSSVEEFVCGINFRLETLRCLALHLGLANLQDFEDIPPQYAAEAARGLSFAIDDFNSRMRAGFEALKQGDELGGYLFPSSKEQRDEKAEAKESAAGA
jgi:hypothetical protein